MAELPISFNDYIGDESRTREYKEFTFNLSGSGIDNKLAIQYCTTNQFDFNEIVILNLKKYFKVYASKYLSGFFNTMTSGELFIGINDMGFVKGIPYQGELPVEMLTKKFYKHLRKTTMNNGFNNYEDIIKIDFIKIDFIKNHTEDSLNPIYTKYLEEKVKVLEIIQKEKEVYEDWKKRYFFIQRKLVDLLNSKESRLLIIDYIKKDNNPSTIVINILESDEIIVSLSNEMISEIVHDRDNPYYWCSEWKEYMCGYLREQKPHFTNIDFDFLVPSTLITSVRTMIPYWIKNNTDMNLYVVHIQYNYELISNIKTTWEYYDNKFKRFMSCNRIINIDGTPSNLRFI